MPSNPNTPIVNAGLKYVNGLDLTYLTATTMTVGAGSARDSSNVNDIVLSASVTLNCGLNGANGLDTGTFASASWYCVYVIGDSTGYKNTASLISLSFSDPILPFGYDMFRRIGCVKTGGMAAMNKFYQLGNGGVRTYYYDVYINELSTGNATVFTSVDLSDSLPPLKTEAIATIILVPGAADHSIQLRPFGSSATDGNVRYGSGAAGTVNFGMVTFPALLDSSVPKVSYKVDDAGDSVELNITGFVDYLE